MNRIAGDVFTFLEAIFGKGWRVLEPIRGWLARARQVAPERYLLLLLVLLAAGLWLTAYLNWPRPLEVVSFSVGDGDCFLIRAPSGHAVMIDCGSRNYHGIGARVIVPNLLLLGVHKLDAIIISHPDSDHVNGYCDVLDALPVGMVLDPEIPDDLTQYQQVVEKAKEKHVPRVCARAGEQLNLGGGVRLHLMAPVTPFITGTDSDTNNNCVVSLLEYRQARMLLTADLEQVGERALLARGGDLHAEIIEAAHHGSRNGCSDALLDAVKPSAAVISCNGDPNSGHPHPLTLARLRQRNIRILRTDVSARSTSPATARTGRSARFVSRSNRPPVSATVRRERPSAAFRHSCQVKVSGSLLRKFSTAS